MINKIILGDCYNVLKEIDDNSIDLVCTSPPYADVVSYGKKVDVKHPKDYIDWLIPIINEIYRVLKPSGSFILNINHYTKNKQKSTYVYDLISKLGAENKIKLYDVYYWHKLSTIPNGSAKRFRNTTEYIFHFCKDPKSLKFYMERVLEPIAENTSKRYKYIINDKTGVDNNGQKINRKRKMVKRHGTGSSNYSNKPRPSQPKYIDENGQVVNNPDHIIRYIEAKDMKRPDNVFRFKTAANTRINKIKHPAPYHIDLPSYFIELLTDENDIVLDPFSGIGTTCLAAKQKNRNWIGIEINKIYQDYSQKLLENKINFS